MFRSCSLSSSWLLFIEKKKRTRSISSVVKSSKLHKTTNILISFYWRRSERQLKKFGFLERGAAIC